VARRICITVPRALRQIAGIRAWWRENREKAPRAFDEDFDEAVDLLYKQPEVGVVVGRTRGGVRTRRIFLERVRYYIYYQVTPNAIFIVAVIQAARRPPRGL
jgi:plasmid stabilization system protein ParE